MRFFQKLLCLSFLTLPIACQWDEEKKEFKEAERYDYKQVLFKEKVTDQTQSIFVQSGDYLKIQVWGKNITPIVSGVFHKHSRSSWKVKKCEREDWRTFRDIAKIAKARICYWEKKKGSCVSNFRQIVDHSEEDLYIDDAKNLRLNYKIGEQIYPLGQMIESDGESSTFRLKISEEMVKDRSNEVKLIVNARENDNTVKVGFLSFHRCAGYGKKKFNAHISTASQIVSSSPWHEYTVNFYTGEKL